MWAPRDPVASVVGNTARTDWRHRLPSSLSVGASPNLPGSPPSPVERTEVMPFDAPYDVHVRAKRESDAQPPQPPPLPAKPFSLAMGAGDSLLHQQQRLSAPACRTGAFDDDGDDSGDDSWTGGPPVKKETAQHSLRDREPAEKGQGWLQENFDSDSDLADASPSGQSSAGENGPAHRSGLPPPTRQPHIPPQPFPVSAASSVTISEPPSQPSSSRRDSSLDQRSGSWDSQPYYSQQPVSLSEGLQAHELYDVRPGPNYHRSSDDGARGSTGAPQHNPLPVAAHGGHGGGGGGGDYLSRMVTEAAVPPQTQTQQKMQQHHQQQYYAQESNAQPPQLPPPPPKPDYMRVEQSQYAMQQQHQRQPAPPSQAPVVPTPPPQLANPAPRRGRRNSSSSSGEVPQASAGVFAPGPPQGLPPRAPSGPDPSYYARQQQQAPQHQAQPQDSNWVDEDWDAE